MGIEIIIRGKAKSGKSALARHIHNCLSLDSIGCRMPTTVIDVAGDQEVMAKMCLGDVLRAIAERLDKQDEEITIRTESVPVAKRPKGV